jgi:UDP-N-acetylmuramate dehydrogenase
MNIEQELKNILKCAIKKDEPMALHTSWMVGGPADYYLCPNDIDDLVAVIRFSAEHKLPLYIMGNGTNLLVLDGGIRGLVVNVGGAFCYIKSTEDGLTVGAGTPMTLLARTAAENGFIGLEFCVGIPGSLGGAVIMNAGAFGGYIGEKVSSVKLVSIEGELQTLPREDLQFGYRTSNLVGRGAIIEIILKLKKGDQAESLKLMEHLLNERRRRHPILPSAGSVFRNLADQPAGRIIESAGCKGLTFGGAVVSEQHANFIVNSGNATAADILALIKIVQQKVREKHNLDLHPEVRIVGEENLS